MSFTHIVKGSLFLSHLKAPSSNQLPAEHPPHSIDKPPIPHPVRVRLHLPATTAPKPCQAAHRDWYSPTLHTETCKRRQAASVHLTPTSIHSTYPPSKSPIGGNYDSASYVIASRLSVPARTRKQRDHCLFQGSTLHLHYCHSSRLPKPIKPRRLIPQT